MDATPLNTSIIILCSAAGCTFGSENCAIFSNVEMSSLRRRKWVVGVKLKYNVLEYVDVPESMSKITGLLEAHKLLSRRAWK